MSDQPETTAKSKPILGLGRLCSFRPYCETNKPCERCLEIGMTESDKAVFTPAQEKEIQDFLDKNSKLMDDLAKSGD
jgi:hypothetical protein